MSEHLYMVGQARTAALHAAHPVQELGNRLLGPVRRVDAARADRLREKLKEPGQDIEAKAPPARYVATAEDYDESFKDGRITQLVEYQDAYGFFRRASAAIQMLE